MIPSLPQAGKLEIAPTTALATSETGASGKFTVRLSAAPKADVTVPVSSTNAREGTASPASLTFTPDNWANGQTVTVTGVNDCAPDGNKAYQALTGQAVTLDPNYIALSGVPVNLVNSDDNDLAATTDNPAVHICNMAIVTERQVNATLWEYTLRPQLTNTGTAFGGVAAKLKPSVPLMQVIQGSVNFGNASQGDTILGNSTVTVQSRSRVPPSVFAKGSGFKWNVTVSP